MLKSKFAIVLASTALTLSACSGGAVRPNPVGAKIARMDPRALANSSTQDSVILDTRMHFDENMKAVDAGRPMTATEALGTAQIEQHCWQLANDRIKGQAKSMIKKVTVGSVLMGLFTGIGSMAFPGAKPLQYGLYGAASGAGSGAFTGSISIEQARSIVVSYCQIAQLTNGDRRLKDIIAIPAVGLSGSRLPVDWSKTTLNPLQKCLQEAGLNAELVKGCKKEEQDRLADEANAPPPPMPQ